MQGAGDPALTERGGFGPSSSYAVIQANPRIAVELPPPTITPTL
jgi:hypothetical protein